MSQHPIIRGEDDYSSDEDDSTGHAPNQALPIANLPFNFDGVPQDGMEYLFTVRFSPVLPSNPSRGITQIRDSRLLPRFTRVDHPSTNSGANVPLALALTAEEDESTNKTLHNTFPSEEWRRGYIQHFLNYRQNLRRVLDAPSAPGRPKVPLPNWQNRNEWWRFITGSPARKIDNNGITEATNSAGVAAAGSGVESERGVVGGHEPTLSILKQFSLRNVTSLLYWFSVWITVYTDALEDSGVQPSGDETGGGHDRTALVGSIVAPDTIRSIEGIHQRWMFALLGMLDTELVGNDISTLRVLARAAIRLVQVLTKDDQGNPGLENGGTPAAPDVNSLVDTEEPSPVATNGDDDKGSQMTIAGCWMVVAAIVGIWGQRDIWDEAQDALSYPVESRAGS